MSSYQLYEINSSVDPSVLTVRTPYFFDQLQLNSLIPIPEPCQLAEPPSPLPDEYDIVLKEKIELGLAKPLSKDGPIFNYTPYHIFCLKSQIYLFLLTAQHGRYRQCQPILMKKPSGSKMIYGVDLYDGDMRLNLSPEMAASLQTEVNRIVVTRPLKCALYSIRKRHNHIRNLYPFEWLIYIVPLIQLPSIYQQEFDPILKTVYVQLQYSDFDTEYDSLSNLFSRELQRLWENGTVYFPQNNGEIFTKQWQLTPLVSYIPVESIKTDSDIIDDKNLSNRYLTETAETFSSVPGLYSAVWIDTRFAPNKTQFLLDRLYGKKLIEIKIGANEVTRHHVASILKDELFYFTDEYVNVESNLYVKSTILADQIMKAKYSSNGKVTTLHFPNKVELLNSEDVIYRVLDPLRPWIYSHLESENVEDVFKNREDLQIQLRSQLRSKINKNTTAKQGKKV